MAPRENFRERKGDHGIIRFAPWVAILVAVIIPIVTSIRSSATTAERVCSIRMEFSDHCKDQKAEQTETIKALGQVNVSLGKVEAELGNLKAEVTMLRQGRRR